MQVGVKCMKIQREVRRIVKADTLQRDGECLDFVALSIYDTKPHVISMVCNDCNG